MQDERNLARTAATRIKTVVVETEIISNRPVALDTSLMELRLPASWGPPAPGQFVSITMDKAWDESSPGTAGSAILRRPFGIAGFRTEDSHSVVEIIYAAVGQVTRRLAAAPPGASVSLLGPRGTGFPILSDRHVVLIAGGRGIAPLIYVACAYQDASLSFDLLFGVRSPDQFVPLGTLAPATTCIAEEGGEVRQGTVIDLLNEMEFSRPPVLMACGPEAMLGAVASWASEHQLECWVSLEAVFGCSLGICGGCAVPSVGDDFHRYLWACRQGPVVNATRIDWESWSGVKQ